FPPGPRLLQRERGENLQCHRRVGLRLREERVGDVVRLAEAERQGKPYGGPNVANYRVDKRICILKELGHFLRYLGDRVDTESAPFPAATIGRGRELSSTATYVKLPSVTRRRFASLRRTTQASMWTQIDVVPTRVSSV